MTNSLLEYVDQIDLKKQANFQRSIENRQLNTTNFEQLDRYLKKGRVIFKKYDCNDQGEIDLENGFESLRFANEVENLLFGDGTQALDLT